MVQSTWRSFSSNKKKDNKDPQFEEFDFQKFADEKRKERQKMDYKNKWEQFKTNANNQGQENQDSQYQQYKQRQKQSWAESKYYQQSSGSEDMKNQGQGERGGGAIMQLAPQIAKDLVLMNLPKHVSRSELRSQYHKLAKMYHPDILSGKEGSLIQPEQKQKLEDKFKDFNEAYERLMKWIKERDHKLDDDLINDRRPGGVTMNKHDGSVTYSIGKLKLEGKRSQLDKQQILMQMVDDDLNLKEPVNLKRNLIILWFIIGLWTFNKEFKQYYAKMSKEQDGVDYSQYFTGTISSSQQRTGVGGGGHQYQSPHFNMIGNYQSSEKKLSPIKKMQSNINNSSQIRTSNTTSNNDLMRMVGSTSGGNLNQGLEFDQVSSKNVYEDTIVRTPDSGTNVFNTLQSSPVKFDREFGGGSLSMMHPTVNLNEQSNDDESIIESMNQLINAVNKLKSENEMTNKQNQYSAKIKQSGKSPIANQTQLQRFITNNKPTVLVTDSQQPPSLPSRNQIIQYSKSLQIDDTQHKQQPIQGPKLILNETLNQSNNKPIKKLKKTSKFLTTNSTNTMTEKVLTNKQNTVMIENNEFPRQNQSQQYQGNQTQRNKSKSPQFRQQNRSKSPLSTRYNQINSSPLQQQNKLSNNGISPKQYFQSKTSPKFTRSPMRQQSPLEGKRLTYGAYQQISSAQGAQQSQQEVNSEVIERLFTTHKRTQYNLEQKKLKLRQEEYQKIQEKPKISARSKQIIQSSNRSALPFHSPLRYQQELEHEKQKHILNQQKREMEQMAKQIEEDQEIERNSITKSEAKLDFNQFQQKYENQIKKWEYQKANGVSPNRELILEESQYNDGSQKQPSFRPQILEKSRQLAQNIETLEKRIKTINQEKRDKIEKIQNSLLPTFTPTINKTSDRIIGQNIGQESTRMVSTFQINNIKQNNQNIRNANTNENNNFTSTVLRRSNSNNAIGTNRSITPPSLRNKNRNHKELDSKTPPPKNTMTKFVNKKKQSPQKVMSSFQSQEWIDNYASSLSKNAELSIPVLQARQNSNSPNKKQSIDTTQNFSMIFKQLQNQNFTQSYNNSTDETQLQILQQYIKLKEEMNISLSNRISIENLSGQTRLVQYPIIDQNSQQMDNNGVRGSIQSMYNDMQVINQHLQNKQNLDSFSQAPVNYYQDYNDEFVQSTPSQQNAQLDSNQRDYASVASNNGNPALSNKNKGQKNQHESSLFQYHSSDKAFNEGSEPFVSGNSNSDYYFPQQSRLQDQEEQYRQMQQQYDMDYQDQNLE